MNQKINIEIKIDNNNELTVTVADGEFKNVYVDTVKHKARFEIANGVTLNVDRVINTIELLTLSNKPKLNLTNEQRTVLEGLYLLGYRYLACDENGCLYTYSTRPHRNMSDTSWGSYGAAIRVNMINDVIINLCSWKDEEPISIEWLLGKTDKNE